MVRLLLSLSASNAVYYLHPSFGYYFENFHMIPRGLVEELKPYAPNSITPPPLSAEELRFNQQAWSQAGGHLDTLAAAVKQKAFDAMMVGRLYSRALDNWGVQLQRQGRYDEAQASFARAIALNPDNRAARLNSESNEALRRGLPPLAQNAKTQKDIFGPYRDWNTALNEFGPYDEPRLCFQLGRVFVQGSHLRQGLIEIIRARTLDPANLAYRVAETEIYLQGNLPDQALATVAAIRKLPSAATLDRTNQFALIRLEAMAHLSKTNYSKAEQMLLKARQTYPDLPAAHEMLAQSYMLSGRFTNALPVLDHQLKTFPGDKSPLMNKAAIYFRINAYDQAIAALDALLKAKPDHLLALQVRAACCVQLNRLDAAKADYERIRQRSPKLPAAEFGLGEIAYLQKKKPAAVAHFEAYLKLVPPGTPDAERARQRLKELKGGG
ncbi:MAG: tetratricopeptide repeat protein [Pedosphaera parvula]|nr:tetratricopeptide repeat protein [Pedosphaera parvula]